MLAALFFASAVGINAQQARFGNEVYFIYPLGKQIIHSDNYTCTLNGEKIYEKNNKHNIQGGHIFTDVKINDRRPYGFGIEDKVTVSVEITEKNKFFGSIVIIDYTQFMEPIGSSFLSPPGKLVNVERYKILKSAYNNLSIRH